LLVSALLLTAGALLFAGAAAVMLRPDAAAVAPFLSYGRLLPAGTGLLLGGLLLGAVACAWWVVPRLGGGPVAGLLMGPAALLVAGGSVAGAVAVAVGLGSGGRYLESPWPAEAALAAGLLLAATAATRSARTAGDGLGIPVWYLLGALWWGFAAAAVAAVPGLQGVPAALQARFAAAVLTGLVPVAAGLGAVYYLVGRLVPDAVFHPRLGVIGFWSLGFSWLWMGPAGLQYGPTPDWLETIPVLFSFGLVVALLAITTDLAHALKGRWAAVAGSRPLRTVVIGFIPFSLLVGQMLLQSLRGPSTVVRFTDWESALDVLLLLGAAGLWLSALTSHALAGDRLRSRIAGAAHLYGVSGGLVLALVGWWVSGLQQGYAWVGSVATGDNANTGGAFWNSVAPPATMRVTALLGLTLIVAGLAAHLLSLSPIRGRGDPGGGEPPRFPAAGGAAQVRRGALALFAVAAVAVFAFPSLEVGRDPSSLAATTREHPDGSPQARGRDIYIAEGCWHCHTQQVRPIITDVGLGPVSVAGDYAYDGADLIGVRRIGPDLTYVASRGWDAARIRGHLADPRATWTWSVMPSFAYLSEADIEALAAYLAALE